jgi:hypothetical protein
MLNLKTGAQWAVFAYVERIWDDRGGMVCCLAFGG